jgi:hypothetical protein
MQYIICSSVFGYFHNNAICDICMQIIPMGAKHIMFFNIDISPIIEMYLRLKKI